MLWICIRNTSPTYAFMEKFKKNISDTTTVLSRAVLPSDDELRFNDASTHEGHLHQNGVLTWVI